MLQQIPLESFTTRNYRDPEHLYPSQQQPSYSGKDGGPANVNHSQICTNCGCVLYLHDLLRRLLNIQRGIKCKSDVCDSVFPNVTHDFLLDLSQGQTSKSYLLHRISNGALSGNILQPCSEGQAPRNF